MGASRSPSSAWGLLPLSVIYGYLPLCLRMTAVVQELLWGNDCLYVIQAHLHFKTYSLRSRGIQGCPCEQIALLETVPLQLN